MQLIKKNHDWSVILDTGRKYELGSVYSLGCKTMFDIIVIFDISDLDNQKIVDFMYGAEDFATNSGLCYIKNAITKYERENGFIKEYEVIKEF